MYKALTLVHEMACDQLHKMEGDRTAETAACNDVYMLLVTLEEAKALSNAWDDMCKSREEVQMANSVIERLRTLCLDDLS